MPLAHHLRPQTLKDYIGQAHLLGEKGPVRRLMETKSPANIIFWGPPGVGKTSLAHLLNMAWNTQWHYLNATLANIQEIKKIIEASKIAAAQGHKSVLFIDELHRFSKTQQDTLLSVVEDGSLVLLGATTENPRFSVIPGLVSRCLIFECKALTEQDLCQILATACSESGLSLDLQAETAVMAYAAGDARKLINIIELLGKLGLPQPISLSQLQAVLPQAARTLDDTTHYDLSSAMIKSLRGSDADAALYWVARLLEAGEDPVFIARRLVIFASEDIGNADPQALPLAVAVMQATQVIGMPEVRINLGQAITYLATAPKSNASYLAIDRAISKVQSGDNQPVPAHLRTRQSQAMSNEKSPYKYPHDFPYAMVDQKYWNESENFYQPKAIGFEREIQKRMSWIYSERSGKPPK